MAFSSAHKWSTHTENKLSPIKFALSNLSYIVRSDQFKIFKKTTLPQENSTVLDVGTTPNETLRDSNLFEQIYPHKKNITAASVEDCGTLVKKYGLKKFVLLQPGKKLPFPDKSFDIATAWATLEHVGNYTEQKKFVEELCRVGKKVFITTPYKFCIYEPHTNMFFLHWLPNSWYRKILQILGKNFWSSVENWNTLGITDIQKMLPKGYRVYLYKSWGFLPSHLIIFK